MTAPSPEAWAANRVARRILAVKLAGLAALPDPLIDEATDVDPDLLWGQLAVVAVYFAHHLARVGHLDLPAQWAAWSELADRAMTEEIT